MDTMSQTMFSIPGTFQKWPRVDISPVESLLVVFAYEKCTKEAVSVEEICNGSLGPKLTQEDFDTALQVL